MNLSKLLKQNKKIILLYLAVLVITLLLRIINLGIIPVFGDEAIYIHWSQVMRRDPIFRFIPLSDGKQPLFMWITIPFMKVFSDPLIAGRLVSVFTAVATLLGIFTLSLLLFNSKKVSLISGLIYATSPFSVFFDRLALADSMLSMFGVWTLVFAVITVRKMRLDTAMLAGFMLGGALLTKSPSLFFSLLIPLSFLLVEWPKKLKNKFSKLSIYIFLFTFTYVIGYGLYNILRLGPNFQMIALRNKDYVYPISHFFTSPFDPLKPFLIRNGEYLWLMGPLVVLISIVAGLYLLFQEKKKEFLLLSAWGILPIIINSEFSKTMTARYIYFCLPYLFVIAAYTFRSLGKKSKFLGIFILAIVLQAIFIDFKLLVNPQSVNLPRSEKSGFLEEWTSGYGIKEISVYLKNKSKTLGDNGKILVATEGYFGTLPDGLQMYVSDIENVEVVGVGQPIKDLPQDFIEKEDYQEKYLVVNSTRLLLNPESVGLELINSYPKAVKPDGTQEELLFFSLKQFDE